jgi:hypothetical protein
VPPVDAATIHTGWVFSALYTHHVCNVLHEVEMVNSFQRMRLEEYDQQIIELKKGNQELI